MNIERAIKSIKIARLTDKQNDNVNWLFKPYSRRLQALEEARSAFVNWKHDVEAGCKGIYRVVELR